MFTPCYDGRFILQASEIHRAEDWNQVVDVIVIWGRGFSSMDGKSGILGALTGLVADLDKNSSTLHACLLIAWVMVGDGC